MKTTRRFFVAAAGGAATWILGFFRARTALAAPERSLDAGVPVAHPDAGTASRAPASLLQLARERYGKYLDEAQLKMLETKLGDIEARSARLHAYKLSNGDGPVTDFRSVRP